MSTIAYARMTNARQAAVDGVAAPASSASTSPGLRTYIDTFAALVPAEVLTLHAVIISMTTTSAAPSGAATGAVILPQAMQTLYFSFWGFLVLSVLLFVVPRYAGGTRWNRFDWIRMCISPLAFVGWTMLQRVTAFDAVYPEMEPIARTVVALFLGAALGAVAAVLAYHDAQMLQVSPPARN